MSLIAELTKARTEEDVKDAYIKALGLKGVFKGLVDIQTEEIWFEAKEAPTPPLLMFAQLLVYVRAARKRGEHVPGFLAVIDREKAAIMPTEHALPVLENKEIVWPKSGSRADMALAALIAPTIETHYVVYEIASHEKEFIAATRSAIAEGKIIRTAITPDNLRQVFDKWVELIGVEMGVSNPADYAVLFFADIMHDGASAAMTNLPVRLLYDANKPVFYFQDRNQTYELASVRGYYNFWKIYHRPPEQKHRHYLLERRDSLLPLDDQKFKGAFYTPLHIVDKAYDQLTATLGEDWQERYIVWDMCAGVGNLEAKHSNLRNVFMSTLDKEDVIIMRSNPAFAGAEIFQYDYLNDDVTDFGEIDYSLSGKVPPVLRQAIADAKEGKKGAKPILVLINPPYAEAMNVDNIKESGTRSGMKQGVSKTRISYGMEHLGYAARELFVQFLHRIMHELPNTKLAIFSTLKYVNAPNFIHFRERWTAQYLDGFVVHSKAFDGLKGNFPIGFLIWDLAVKEPSQSVGVIVLDRHGAAIGNHTFFRELPRLPLSEWIARPRSNETPAIPLKNAITPTTSTVDVRGRWWADGALGSMISKGNDFQNAGQQTALLSSGYCSAGAFFVTSENVAETAVLFSVRMLIDHRWVIHNDQFLQPSHQLSESFKFDCLIWMLFNGKNLSAGADGLEWNERTWSLTNHFVPFAEADVGAKGRYESDFMVRYMKDMAFSPEAQAVLDEGRKLFQRFHATDFPRKVRDEYRLGRPDAGWYQVRKALEAYGDTALTDFDPFKAAYKALGDKLRPMVYELGFLPV